MYRLNLTINHVCALNTSTCSLALSANYEQIRILLTILSILTMTRSETKEGRNG